MGPQYIGGHNREAQCSTNMHCAIWRSASASDASRRDVMHRFINRCWGLHDSPSSTVIDGDVTTIRHTAQAADKAWTVKGAFLSTRLLTNTYVRWPSVMVCRTKCTVSRRICGNSSTILVYGSARFFAAHRTTSTACADPAQGMGL